jgi:hypothetical protein
MTIKVYKVAEVAGGHVYIQDQGTGRFKAGDIGMILTGLEPGDDPIPDSAWKLNLLIGEGVAARNVVVDLPPLLPKSYQRDVPFFLVRDTSSAFAAGERSGQRVSLAYFHERLFLSERPPASIIEQDEIILRVKKAIYEEETELSSLRAAVANWEAAIEYQRSGSKRDPIPEDVKLVVWARDGGACTRCGSKQDLHFDHIIPIAKGGGNTEANIQILCQACNLRKSDKIAVT